MTSKSEKRKRVISKKAPINELFMHGFKIAKTQENTQQQIIKNTDNENY